MLYQIEFYDTRKFKDFDHAESSLGLHTICFFHEPDVYKMSQAASDAIGYFYNYRLISHCPDEFNYHQC